MSRVTRAAKSARANFCSDTLAKLTDACVVAAKDPHIGTALAPLAFDRLFRALVERPSGPVSSARVSSLQTRLDPLLDILERSGIQNGERFNHRIDDAEGLVGPALAFKTAP